MLIEKYENTILFSSMTFFYYLSGFLFYIAVY